MGIVGILWFIGIFAKIFAFTSISWAWVIFWPVPVFIILWAIGLVLGVSFLALGARRI